MPSAFTSHRTVEEDLQALGTYSRYRYARLADRSQAKEAAMSGLKSYFFRYGHYFQVPRRLLASGKLRKLSEFLYSLYDSNAIQFKYIDELRDMDDLGACLYCGLPKNITVDHYLPRKLKAFPHYSFLSLNLVPACSACQSSKGSFYPEDRISTQTPVKGLRRAMTLRLHREGMTVELKRRKRNDSGKAHKLRLRSVAAKRRMGNVRIRETRRIIHPYFDNFLRKPVFDLDLDWNKEQPRIERFLLRSHLTSAQRALLSFHLNRLNVKDRSRGHIRRVHRAFTETVAEKGLDQTGIRQQIDIMILNAEKKAGLANSIEASYFKALRQEESRHALLATASHQPKPQRLLTESIAVPTQSKRRKRQAKMFGY